MFVIVMDHRKKKVENFSSADFDFEKGTGRIWLPSSRHPKYLDGYLRKTDSSLKCSHVSENTTHFGFACVGYLKGEDGKQPPLRFHFS